MEVHVWALFFYADDENRGDDSDTNLGLQSNSRIGAKVKNGDVSGRFEYGTSGGNANIRHLYATYKIPQGQILIGQTETPVNFIISKQAGGTKTYQSSGINNRGGDDCMFYYGASYTGRTPMIQFSKDALKVAAVQPKGASNLGLAGGDVDVILPRIEGSYHLDLPQGDYYADLFGGLQLYNLKGGDVDESVLSFVLGATGGGTYGPAYGKGLFYLSQNAKQYGMATLGASSAVVSGSSVDNCMTYGLVLIGGYKVDDMISAEAGWGYAVHVLDSTVVDVNGKSKDAENDGTVSFYVNAQITLAPGVMVVPEMGLVGLMDDNKGSGEGQDIYFGAKWQINF